MMLATEIFGDKGIREVMQHCYWLLIKAEQDHICILIAGGICVHTGDVGVIQRSVRGVVSIHPPNHSYTSHLIIIHTLWSPL